MMPLYLLAISYISRLNFSAILVLSNIVTRLTKSLMYILYRSILIIKIYFSEPYCPFTFDGWSCWPNTPAGSTVYAPCPSFITGFDASCKYHINIYTNVRINKCYFLILSTQNIFIRIILLRFMFKYEMLYTCVLMK